MESTSIFWNLALNFEENVPKKNIANVKLAL